MSFILDRVGLWIIRNFFWLPGDESWVRRGAGPRGQAKDQCGLDQLGEEIKVGRRKWRRDYKEAGGIFGE